MSRGRPPSGPRLVDGLEGSESAKERLRVVLQTVAGEISVLDACSKLNVSEARFHELRAELLQAAVSLLEPKPAGRPAEKLSPEAAEIASLKAQIQDLKVDLRATQIREELALVMPHVLKPRKLKPMDRRQRLDALQEAEKKLGSPIAILCHTSKDAKNSIPNDSNKSGNC